MAKPREPWSYTNTPKVSKESLAKEGFKKYQRHKYFCVFSKYDKDGNFLYRESFNWFEMGKVLKPEKGITSRVPHTTKAHKGGH